MRTDVPASDFGAAYDERPWLRTYPPDVAPTLDYPDQTVWELLEATVAAHGEKTAFVFQNRGLTFKQLQSFADLMAGALSRAGVQRGEAVLLLLPNLPHFPVAYHGTLKLGAAVAAAPPNAVEREIEQILKDSRARVVITVDLLYEKIEAAWERSGVELVVVGTAVDFMPPWVRLAARLTRKVPRPKTPVPYGGRVRRMAQFLASGRRADTRADVDPSEVAVLQYTGGTTGTPKAAMLTHRNLIANAVQMTSWFPSLRTGEETILAVLPFFHVYGVTLVMNAGLLLAARTVLIPRPIMSDILDSIDRYRPTILPGVPTLYVAIVNDDRAPNHDLSSIDICVSGGAPLPLELKRRFEELTGGHLYEGYGLSEASPVTHAQPYAGEAPEGSMGLPLPDTDARILDDSGVAVPPGEEGELAIRGPQIMKGYWGRPDETAAVLRDGWLLTGDIARMDAAGWFYIVDRKKDIIITGGENLYPREIEEVLFEHPAVSEVAVVGVPHDYGGEVAKAFIVLKPGADVTKRDIIQFASQRLSKTKVPRAIEFREELPRSAAQKVLRRILAEEERAKYAQRRRRTEEIRGSDDPAPAS